ncbi:MAG: hypothetical protein LBR80_15780 [Deltaproteobacteria bacterium]|jgi:hypothetical protein|nr:hypothetical protein [Deltaproteobacteria bacterium]
MPSPPKAPPENPVAAALFRQLEAASRADVNPFRRGPGRELVSVLGARFPEAAVLSSAAFPFDGEGWVSGEALRAAAECALKRGAGLVELQPSGNLAWVPGLRPDPPASASPPARHGQVGAPPVSLCPFWGPCLGREQGALGTFRGLFAILARDGRPGFRTGLAGCARDCRRVIERSDLAALPEGPQGGLSVWIGGRHGPFRPLVTPIPWRIFPAEYPGDLADFIFKVQDLHDTFARRGETFPELTARLGLPKAERLLGIARPEPPREGCGAAMVGGAPDAATAPEASVSEEASDAAKARSGTARSVAEPAAGARAGTSIGVPPESGGKAGVVYGGPVRERAATEIAPADSRAEAGDRAETVAEATPETAGGTDGVAGCPIGEGPPKEIAASGTLPATDAATPSEAAGNAEDASSAPVFAEPAFTITEAEPDDGIGGARAETDAEPDTAGSAESFTAEPVFAEAVLAVPATEGATLDARAETTAEAAPEADRDACDVSAEPVFAVPVRAEPATDDSAANAWAEPTAESAQEANGDAWDVSAESHFSSPARAEPATTYAAADAMAEHDAEAAPEAGGSTEDVSDEPSFAYDVRAEPATDYSAADAWAEPDAEAAPEAGGSTEDVSEQPSFAYDVRAEPATGYAAADAWAETAPEAAPEADGDAWAVFAGPAYAESATEGSIGNAWTETAAEANGVAESPDEEHVFSVAATEASADDAQEDADADFSPEAAESAGAAGTLRAPSAVAAPETRDLDEGDAEALGLAPGGEPTGEIPYGAWDDADARAALDAWAASGDDLEADLEAGSEEPVTGDAADGPGAAPPASDLEAGPSVALPALDPSLDPSLDHEDDRERAGISGDFPGPAPPKRRSP